MVLAFVARVQKAQWVNPRCCALCHARRQRAGTELRRPPDAPRPHGPSGKGQIYVGLSLTKQSTGIKSWPLNTQLLPRVVKWQAHITDSRSASAFPLLWFVALAEVWEGRWAWHRRRDGEEGASLTAWSLLLRMEERRRYQGKGLVPLSVVTWTTAFPTDHQVYLKEQPTDELWLFRPGIWQILSWKWTQRACHFKEKQLEVLVANNKIWTFQWNQNFGQHPNT